MQYLRHNWILVPFCICSLAGGTHRSFAASTFLQPMSFMVAGGTATIVPATEVHFVKYAHQSAMGFNFTSKRSNENLHFEIRGDVLDISGSPADGATHLDFDVQVPEGVKTVDFNVSLSEGATVIIFPKDDKDPTHHTTWTSSGPKAVLTKPPVRSSETPSIPIPPQEGISFIHATTFLITGQATIRMPEGVSWVKAPNSGMGFNLEHGAYKGVVHFEWASKKPGQTIYEMLQVTANPGTIQLDVDLQSPDKTAAFAFDTSLYSGGSVVAFKKGERQRAYRIITDTPSPPPSTSSPTSTTPPSDLDMLIQVTSGTGDKIGGNLTVTNPSTGKTVQRRFEPRTDKGIITTSIYTAILECGFPASLDGLNNSIRTRKGVTITLFGAIYVSR